MRGVALVAAAAAAAAFATSCIADDGGGAGARGPAAWRGHADAYGYIPNGRPSLRLLVSGPAKVPYVPALLGAGPQQATLRVKNLGREPFALPRTTTSFEARRDGVAFSCRTTAAPGRETRTIAPQETVWLERDLDCDMPLPGIYDLRGRVRFDDAPDASADEAGVFTTEVIGAGPNLPVPYPHHAGLYVAATAPTPLPPSPGGTTALVAFTNARPIPLDLGAVHVALDVRRGGESVECAAGARDLWLRAPASLASGHTHVARVPVRCALATTATYEVLVWATLGDSPVREGCALPSILVDATDAPYIPPIDLPAERRPLSTLPSP